MTSEETSPLRARLIRERNQRMILRLIFRSGSLSQSRAVLKTGLKAPTAFRIFSELEKNGLIEPVESHEESAEQKGKKGRKPVSYRLKPDAAYVAGVDFWAHSAAAILQDFGGKQVAERSLCFASPPSAEEALNLIASLVRDMLDESGIKPDQLLGIGVGAPGSVGISTGVVHYYARIPGMVQYPLAHHLHELLSVPVIVSNNASIVAMAEQRYGTARNAASLFTFLVRAGVGGAYLQNGKLVSDHSRTAFEVGHLSVDHEGLQCSCGNRGCLELYLNEEEICRALSPLGPCAEIGDADRLIAAHPAEAAQCLETILNYAAHAVRDIRRLLAPEVVVIVTRSRHLSDLIVQAASEDYIHHDQRFGPSGSRILGAEYSAMLACRAACDMVYEEYFSHGFEAR